METKLQGDITIAKVGFESDLVFGCSCSNTSRIFQNIKSITKRDMIPPVVSLTLLRLVLMTTKHNYLTNVSFPSISKIHLSLCL